MNDDAALAACADAAKQYERRCGWPCVADGFAVWTLAGQALDAIDVPAGMGRAVLAALHGDTDVIEVPGDPAPAWRFLVQPGRPAAREWRAELARSGGAHLTDADRVELPPTRVPAGELRWVRAPNGRLTEPDTFVAALRHAVDQG